MGNDFSGYTEFALSSLLSDDAIINALHNLFGVDSNRILVNRDGDWWLKPHENAIIICDIREISGEFPAYMEFLSFHPLSSSLFPHLEAIGKLCELLECRALVPDATSYSPYAFVLVTRISDHTQVRVNPDSLDNEGVFVIETVLDDE